MSILEKGKTIKRLGSGSYGYVDLVRSPNGGLYAIKTQEISSKNLSFNILAEIYVLNIFKKVEQLVEMIEYKISKTECKIVMEYMPMNLNDFIKNTPFDARIRYTKNLLVNICKGLNALRYYNIHHFDLKPGNILVDIRTTGAVFKICDFGLIGVSITGYSYPGHNVYTTHYRPPEFIARRNRWTFSLESGDVWTIAMVILEYIYGSYPFKFGKSFELLEQIRLYSSYQGEPEDFSSDIVRGNVTGYLEISRFLLSKMNAREKEKLPMNILSIIDNMSHINPDARPRFVNVLNDLKEYHIIPNIFTPPVIRKATKEGVRAIVNLGKSLKMKNTVIISSLELYTRVLGNRPNIEDTIGVAISCLQLMCDFLEKSTYASKELLDLYSTINKKYVCYRRNIDELSFRIVKIVKFFIYNPKIVSVIKRFHKFNLDLDIIIYSEYAKPLKSWFYKERRNSL